MLWSLHVWNAFMWRAFVFGITLGSSDENCCIGKTTPSMSSCSWKPLGTWYLITFRYLCFFMELHCLYKCCSLKQERDFQFLNETIAIHRNNFSANKCYRRLDWKVTTAIAGEGLVFLMESKYYVALLHNVFCWEVKLCSGELSLEAYSLGFMSRTGFSIKWL